MELAQGPTVFPAKYGMVLQDGAPQL
jgi:hypothetical protein